MKTLIVANWKINPSTEKEAVDLFNSVKNGVKDAENTEVVICPPFVYLPLLKGLTLGAQNVFYKEEKHLPSTTFATEVISDNDHDVGSKFSKNDKNLNHKSGAGFTGEVSPKQLKDLGVKYVIVGHSEARKLLNETDEIINKKVKELLHVGLKPILCVGENEGENKEEVLERQITEGLKDLSEKELENIVVAYEPVWAIGTGKNCSVEETKSSIELIKKLTSKNIKVLYGGSVNSSNASDYLENGGVSGLLVGGASLKPEEFIKIVKLAE